MANLRFVVSVAKAHQRNNPVLALEDLINDGNYGMIEAANLFDPTTGFKFISFAVWHIRRRMQESILKNSRHVRLPSNQVWAMNKINDIQSRYINDHDRFPTVDELHEELQKLDNPPNIAKKNLARVIMNYENGTSSLDGAKDPDNEYVPLNYMEAEETPDGTESHDLDNIFETLFKSLDKPEVEMICMSLGIGKYTEKYTKKMIGDRFGLTAESVRLKLRKAYKKIRNNNSHFLNIIKDEISWN